MGPGRAADIIREGLFRGADNGYLLTDRAFAGADTLATSYALATAIRKIGDCDIIIGGRQAIDVNGDLAQCGLSGSPTKVKAIQNIVFQAKESKTISGSDRDVEDLIVELLANHTIG